MALEPIEQFQELVSKAKQPLILIGENPNGDAISSAWALSHFFKTKNIEAPVAFSDPFEKKKQFTFLPQPENIMESVTGARDFVLIFNTEYNNIKKVETERRDKELRIYLTPEQGSIDPRDFSFVPAKSKYDLVFVLGCSDKESLGKLYEDNADLLYEVPVINLDHHSDNDHFGQVNIVDMTASCTAEVLANALQQKYADSIDDVIAQCLLTGVIIGTDSFQKSNTTPRSLQVAARLIEKGADQQELIRLLYKTQPFYILKLWGRVMAKLNWSEALGLVWTTVQLEDFVQSRSKPTDLPIILEKIKSNYSVGKIFLLMYVKDSQEIGGFLKVADQAILKKLQQALPGQMKGEYFEFNLQETNPQKAEVDVIEKIKSVQQI